MDYDSPEYQLYELYNQQDTATLKEMTRRVYGIIQTLNLPPAATIGMYFGADNMGYIKHSVKSGFTLLGRVRFNNENTYPSVLDARKIYAGDDEVDDYAVVDLSEQTEEVSVIYGMNIPSQSEINLFSISLFPVTFEVESDILEEAVSSGENSHLSKSISISKFVVKNGNLEIKTCKGRNTIKKTNIQLDKLSLLRREKFETSISSGLLESIIYGDHTIVRLHQGVVAITNKADGELLNFDFIIYKNQIQIHDV